MPHLVVHFWYVFFRKYTNCIKRGPQYQKEFWGIKCQTFPKSKSKSKSILYLYAQQPPSPDPPHKLYVEPGGVRTKTPMHFYCQISTWRKIVVMRAFVAVYLLIVFSAFAHLFYTKMLYLASMRVAKSHFGTEVLSVRACQGKYGISWTRKISHIFVFL